MVDVLDLPATWYMIVISWITDKSESQICSSIVKTWVRR